MEPLVLLVPKAPCHATFRGTTVGTSALKPKAYAPIYMCTLSYFLVVESLASVKQDLFGHNGTSSQYMMPRRPANPPSAAAGSGVSAGTPPLSH